MAPVWGRYLAMQQVFDTMSEATGVDFREILKAQTYDAKVNHNLNLTGIPGGTEHGGEES